jgi:hypothetical protein
MAKKPLAPLGPLFTVLNWVACAGWSYILYDLLTNQYISYPNLSDVDEHVLTVVLGLEVICIVEVVRIVLGDLPGNLVLGLVLHAIRFTALTQILPRLQNHWTGPAVIASWAVTEVTRYPMYIFPKSEACRSVRMVVPLFTFPIGAFSEAYGAFLVLSAEDTPSLLKMAIWIVLFVNGVLGPTMAYPALLKKGLPVVGLGKRRDTKQSLKKME